jgi:hypothetical protein
MMFGPRLRTSAKTMPIIAGIRVERAIPIPAPITKAKRASAFPKKPVVQPKIVFKSAPNYDRPPVPPPVPDASALNPTAAKARPTIRPRENLILFICILPV